MSKRRIELYLIDISIIIAVYALAAILEASNVTSIQANGELTIWKLLLLIGCVQGIRGILKVYDNIWRYANVNVYLQLMLSDTLAGMLLIMIGRMMPQVSLGFAYSLFVIMGVILLTLASRFVYQVGYAVGSRYTDSKEVANGQSQMHKINVAIVGAGNVGATLAEEFMRNPKSHYHPYCFIDRDVNKAGHVLNGIRIYPEGVEIIEKIKDMPIQEIIIALPDSSLKERAELYSLYRQTDCKVKIYDYPLHNEERPEGKRALREFQIEDLLFRDSLSIDNVRTRQFYEGKTILVTGGGGSIGSELCRQIVVLNPKKLVILDIYENNAYEIQQELLRKYGEKLELEVIIASVRDTKRMEEVFAKIRPEIVFHAAAHKHVPLMENNGCEAIKNNVMGTYKVANMAEKYGTQKFVLISTDKAVNPTNIMGASKRLCEMVIQCRQNSKTEFAAVRFGNVLGSNGSVIPLFRKQIEAGGLITLTDKRIIRYFMTIPEAVGLVMETGAMAHNGELYVLNMGKPVKILDLAENMIQLSGLKPYEDIDIVEIGLRPGEKLYEELLMKNEELDKTSNELIFIERDKCLSREEVDQKLRILSHAMEQGGYEAIVRAIQKTVPTYHNPEEVNDNALMAEEMRLAGSEAAITEVG